MTVQSFRERMQYRIDQRIEQLTAQHQNLHNCYPANAIAGVGTVPALTPEQIGMMAIDNCVRLAELRATRDWLDETFRELVDDRPAQEEVGSGEVDTGNRINEADERGGYG